MTTADVLALVPEPEPEAALETARAEDRERVGTARADSRSAATRRAYRAQWKTFLDWCAVRQVNALPADAGDVAAFLADRAREKRAATVAQGAAAIRAAHHAADLPDPTATPVVRETLQGIRHQHARLPELAPRQAKPLDYDGAVKLLALSDRPQPSGRNGLERPERAASRGSLDRCIVALLFCAGMRRSEVAALRWADVEETARPGQLRVRVRTSKANQDGARADWRLLVSGFAAALRDRRERVRARRRGPRRAAVARAGGAPAGRAGARRRHRGAVGALRAGRHGRRPHPPRGLDDQRAGRGRLARPRHGRPLRGVGGRGGRRDRPLLRERGMTIFTGKEGRMEREDRGMDRDQARALLGLNEGASDAEIKRAYRDLMHTVHPDRHGGDPAAARLAVLANEAKDVLLAGGGAEVRPPRPPWDEAPEEPECPAREEEPFRAGPGGPPGRDPSADASHGRPRAAEPPFGGAVALLAAVALPVAMIALLVWARAPAQAPESVVQSERVSAQSIARTAAATGRLPSDPVEQEVLLAESYLPNVERNMFANAAPAKTPRQIARQGAGFAVACMSSEDLQVILEGAVEEVESRGGGPAPPPGEWMGLAVEPEGAELPVLPCSLMGVEVDPSDAVRLAVQALPHERLDGSLPLFGNYVTEPMAVRTPYTCGLHVLEWPPLTTFGTVTPSPFVSSIEALESGLAERDYGRFITDASNYTITAHTVAWDKGEKDAAGWMPHFFPSGNRSWYARKVVEVKRKYGLSVDPAEQRALARAYDADAEVECPSRG